MLKPEMISTVFDLSRDDLPFAEAAARRLAATHTDLRLTLGETAVFVSGPATAAETQRAWAAALLNERLIQEAEHKRRAILESLIR